MNTWPIVQIGIVIVPLVLLVALVLYARSNPQKFRGWIGFLAGFQSKPEALAASSSAAVLPTDTAMARNATMEELLPLLRRGQTVALTGMGEQTVAAAVKLWEMEQRTNDAPWTKKKQTPLTAVRFSNGKWVVRLPTAEAGRAEWFLLSEYDPNGLYPFFTRDASPAVRFADADQRAPVPYNFPVAPFEGRRFEVVDLGAFKAEVAGSCEDVIYEDDFVYFVTSKARVGDDWALFLDARDEARGRGTLLAGEQVDPRALIGGIL